MRFSAILLAAMMALAACSNTPNPREPGATADHPTAGDYNQ